jgi:hypothetical protein
MVVDFRPSTLEKSRPDEPARVLRIDRADNQRFINQQIAKGGRVLHDMRIVFDRGCTDCKREWIAPSPLGACPRCGADAELTLSTAQPRFLNYVRS